MDLIRMGPGMPNGVDGANIIGLDTLPLRMIDSLHAYRNQLWKAEGLDESWWGTTANGFAWAGTGALYSAALVYAWGAAELPTMEVSIKAGSDLPFLVHFQFGVNGVGQVGVGGGGSCWVV